jgi:hypothetical protein
LLNSKIIIKRNELNIHCIESYVRKEGMEGDSAGTDYRFLLENPPALTLAGRWQERKETE